MQTLGSYRNDESAATAIGYGMIASLIGVGILSAVTMTGNETKNTLFSISSAMVGDFLGGSGTFEESSVTDSVFNHWDNKDANGAGYLRAGGLDGWDTTGFGQVDVLENGREGIFTPNGTNFVDLRASNAAQNSGLGQTLDQLADGQTVNLSFLASSTRENYQTTMEVVFGGEVVDTIVSNGEAFDLFNYDLVGGSGDGSNYLELRAVGTEGTNRGTSLTEIKVE